MFGNIDIEVDGYLTHIIEVKINGDKYAHFFHTKEHVNKFLSEISDDVRYLLESEVSVKNGKHQTDFTIHLKRKTEGPHNFSGKWSHKFFSFSGQRIIDPIMLFKFVDGEEILKGHEDFYGAF